MSRPLYIFHSCTDLRSTYGIQDNKIIIFQVVRSNHQGRVHKVQLFCRVMQGIPRSWTQPRSRSRRTPQNTHRQFHEGRGGKPDVPKVARKLVQPEKQPTSVRYIFGNLTRHCAWYEYYTLIKKVLVDIQLSAKKWPRSSGAPSSRTTRLTAWQPVASSTRWWARPLSIPRRANWSLRASTAVWQPRQRSTR